METDENRCHTRPSGGRGQELGNSVLDHLYAIQEGFTEARKTGIAVIKLRRYKSMD